MALSMFQACVPVITQLLNGLSVVVDKTAAHVAEKKYDEQAFLQTRLFPDMFPLGRQIRQATDFGRNAPGRLSGVDLPAFPDADASFAEAKARIAKSIDFVKGFTPGTDRRHRGEGYQLEGWRAHDVIQGAGLSAAFLPAALLLPLHHRLQHRAPQRRRDRQARLYGYAVTLAASSSLPHCGREDACVPALSSAARGTAGNFRCGYRR